MENKDPDKDKKEGGKKAPTMSKDRSVRREKKRKSYSTSRSRSRSREDRRSRDRGSSRKSRSRERRRRSRSVSHRSRYSYDRDRRYTRSRSRSLRTRHRYRSHTRSRSRDYRRKEKERSPSRRRDYRSERRRKSVSSEEDIRIVKRSTKKTLRDVSNVKRTKDPRTRRDLEDPLVLSEGEVISEEDTGEDPVGYSYAQRLLLLHKVLGMGVNPQEEKVGTVFGSKKKNPRLRLPPSQGFTEMFDSYLSEVKGSEGSRRAKSNPRLPLDVNKVPPRHRPNIKAYELDGDAWRRQAGRHNTSLNCTTLGFNSIPQANIPYERLMDLESSAREELSISSYNTWFLQAAQQNLRNLQERLVDLKNSEVPVTPKKEDWDMLWNEIEDVTEFIDSAGIGTKAIAENAVSDIGSCVLTRRDVWLNPLVKQEKITKQDMWELRGSNLNDSNLFDQGILERVIEKAEKTRAEKLQRKLVYGCFDKVKQDSKESRQGSHRRPYESHGSFRGSSQNTGWSAGGYSRGGNRGQRGRRNRGNRGIPRRPPPEATITKADH